jgi:hypothetical protein
MQEAIIKSWQKSESYVTTWQYERNLHDTFHLRDITVGYWICVMKMCETAYVSELSYNESPWDALFLKFILKCTLHVSDMSIIRSISKLHTPDRYLSCKFCWRLLADSNRTSMTNTYCVYTVFRYSWWWTVDLSETCRVLHQINLRNSASRWL